MARRNPRYRRITIALVTESKPQLGAFEIEWEVDTGPGGKYVPAFRFRPQGKHLATLIYDESSGQWNLVGELLGSSALRIMRDDKLTDKSIRYALHQATAELADLVWQAAVHSALMRLP